MTRTGSGAEVRLARLDWVTLVSALAFVPVVAPGVIVEFDEVLPVVAPRLVVELEFLVAPAALEPVEFPVVLEFRSVPMAPEGLLPVRLPVVAPEVEEGELELEERSPVLRLLPVVLPALFMRSPEVTPEPVLVELAFASVFALSLADPDVERLPDIEPELVVDDPEVAPLLVEPVLVEPLAPEPLAPLPAPAEPDDWAEAVSRPAQRAATMRLNFEDFFMAAMGFSFG